MPDEVKVSSIEREGICPRCGGAQTVVPIAYGMPSPEMEAEEARGEIVLGGCCVGRGDPTHYCRGCEQTFGSVSY